MFDFQYISTEQIPLDGEVVLTGGSLEECSKQCVTADGFKCKSFDYLVDNINDVNDDSVCLLNSGDKRSGQSGNNILKFGYCAHYKRKEKRNFFCLIINCILLRTCIF